MDKSGIGSPISPTYRIEKLPRNPYFNENSPL